MRYFPYYLTFYLLCFITKVSADEDKQLTLLKQHHWNAGAENCAKSTEPTIEIYQYDESTYILRQNKCSHYEAPFIYLLFGEHTVFIQDTGATESSKDFPIYQTVMSLVKHFAKTNKYVLNDYQIVVSHSHSHSDHTAGDKQFMNQNNVVVIPATLSGVKNYFGYHNDKLNWPHDIATLDIGERSLSIIPLPGHQTEALAIYDKKTKLLFTGDSFYPGRLYVKEWSRYQQSIERLTHFADLHSITALLGTHIEMSTTAGIDYPMGITFQPKEAQLPLAITELIKLNKLLNKYQMPQRVVTDNFILFPVD